MMHNRFLCANPPRDDLNNYQVSPREQILTATPSQENKVQNWNMNRPQEGGSES